MKKEIIDLEECFEKIDFLLEDIQANIFNKAQKFTRRTLEEANTYDEFKVYHKKQGGFVSAHWDGIF